MKKFLKHFKKFKLTALIEGCAGVVSIVTSIVILILHQTVFSRDFGTPEKPKIVTYTGFYNQPIIGMIFFLSALLVIIFGIVTVYTAYPFLFKKDQKQEPKKIITWWGVTTGGFGLITAIFTFVMAFNQPSNAAMVKHHTVGLIVCGILLLLATIVQLLMIAPRLLVRIEKEQ